MYGYIFGMVLGGAVIIAGSKLRGIASKEKDRAAWVLGITLTAIGSVAVKGSMEHKKDLDTGKLVMMTCLSEPGGWREQRPLYTCLGKAPVQGDPFQAPYTSLVAKAVRPQPVAKTPAGRALYIDG